MPIPERLPCEDPRDYLARLVAWDNKNERILMYVTVATAAMFALCLVSFLSLL